MANIQQNDKTCYTTFDFVNNILVLKPWDNDQEYIALGEARFSSRIYNKVYNYFFSGIKDMFTLNQFVENIKDYIKGDLLSYSYEGCIVNAVQIDTHQHSISLRPILLEDACNHENRYLGDINPIRFTNHNDFPKSRTFALFTYDHDLPSDYITCLYLREEDENLSLYSLEINDKFRPTDYAGFMHDFINYAEYTLRDFYIPPMIN